MFIGFLYGCVTMYLLGGILHMSMLESTDPDQPNNHIKFSLMWPIAAVVAVYDTILDTIYGDDTDE